MYTQKKFFTPIIWYCLTIGLFSSIIIYAGIPDNRYLPLYAQSLLKSDPNPSFFGIDALVATANKAYNDAENEIGIPELSGAFDLGKFGQAFTLTGRTNLLPSFIQGISIPYRVEGKIQVQGINFNYYQSLTDWLSIGASWLCMRINTHQEFILKPSEVYVPLTPSLLLQLDDIRRAMFDQLGFKQNHVSQVGMGDFEVFVRFGQWWNYVLKCRNIDVGCRIGALLPSGEKADINAPSSIPFGGNGQYGAYIAVDGLFELKQDIKVGLNMQLSKRIARTQLFRLPALNEPALFGTTTAHVHFNQGTTLVFSPYFVLENLQKGLGAGVQYTLTKHQEDEFKIESTSTGKVGDLKQLRESSAWASDYFLINIFYDFGKTKVARSFNPIISLSWNVPSLIFVTKNTAKTHKISLGIGFSF